MKKIKPKNTTLLIRINEEEKAKIAQLASNAGMGISSYMRLKGLSTDSDFLKSLPDTVKSWNMLNEICHEIQKSDNQQLKIRIQKILNSQEDSK